MVALTATLVVASCTVGQPDSVPAVWRIEPGQQIDADTTEFTALVSALGCNSGKTGTPSEPVVKETKDHVEVRFTATGSGEDTGSCQGTNEVPVTVKLPSALGERELIDSECLDGGAAVETAFCDVP